ncbi:hypothetical protein PLICRDRAFT_175189 [Plicaturopsis crispa FD-325 SS-3]|nr:hypothetical protein PLICRDRAFT_175189 [Plicaturopsis crispa FD-325 SS-3]
MASAGTPPSSTGDERQPETTGDDRQTIFSPETCTRKGLCPVTQLRHQSEPFESHSLYFEQHGAGPTKVVFIMGLNGSSFGWEYQVAYFGRLPEYSVLVFDNRGVGHSGAPRGPYSTSEMAKDVVTLLDYVGWTEKRDLHVVGISLGGMISQELATLIPERIVSLTLAVTTPGGRPWTNLPSVKGIKTLARLLTIKEPEVKIPLLLDMVYPRAWLDAKAADDPQGRTNEQVQTDSLHARIAITTPQTALGAFSQMAAGLTHHVAPPRLAAISSRIPKVTIVTGDDDNLVDPNNSRRMKAAMREAELVEWEGTGHAIHGQDVRRFNGLVERTVGEGKARLMEMSA